MSGNQTTAVVGDVGNPRRVSRRTLYISLVSGLLAVAALLGLWMLGAFDKPKTTPKAAQFTAQNTNDAFAAAASGDYAQAQKDMDSQIKRLTSNTDKAQAYTTQASLAYNAGKYDDAKNYATKAEALAPSDVTAVTLGDIAAKQNDKTTAAKYYQKAIDRINKTRQGYLNQLNSYQQKLQAARS